MLERYLIRVVVAAIRYFRWRLIEISNPYRIGHLCIEVDCFLKDMILRGEKPRGIFVAKTDRGFANDTIARYLSKYVRIIRSQFLLSCFRRAGPSALTKTHAYAVAINNAARCYDVYARWGRRPPLFRLTNRDKRFGAAQLRRMGVPEGAWFACLHAREAGYSPTDEAWHSYRNTDIEDYGLAIEEITRRGGWCIRMGDATMTPIRPRANVVDYALSEMKSARMDVFLGASCRFILGCASGPTAIAALFGKPSAVVNMAPMSAGYSFFVDDLSIPQRVSLFPDRLLSFEEIMGLQVATLRLTQEFEQYGASLIKCTPEEIRELVLEMIERLEGRASYSPQDEDRQARFKALFAKHHYAYGAGSRIGRDFLNRYMAD